MRKNETIAERLSRYIKVEIGERSLRECAKEIGISHSTLQRATLSKNLPDTESFIKIIKWLNVNPVYIIGMGDTNWSDMKPIKMDLLKDFQDFLSGVES